MFLPCNFDNALHRKTLNILEELQQVEAQNEAKEPQIIKSKETIYEEKIKELKDLC